MIQRISEPVSVITTFNAATRSARPISLEWSRRTYPVLQVGLRHTYRDGITRHHIFSVVSNNLFFRLNLNADNLSWTLEEVSDGLPD
jgi:hypothetical protein